MDTLPLPPRPNLEQYKKRAKDLVAAAKSKNPDAVRGWATDWLAAIAKATGVEITPFVQGSFDRAIAELVARVREKAGAPGARDSKFTLADAQHLIASAHSFENWAAFANHIEHKFDGDPKSREFESAVDAVVTGDLATLELFVRGNLDIVRARSARKHRATLLHYVAANGVEDFRQKTPPNAVAVARFLLEAGAAADALASMYGDDYWQTTMNLLVSSTHPAEAGLQSALVEVLVDFGAAPNGLKDDESPLMTALDFGYGDAAETLARRGARIDSVVAAAALGRVDLVEEFVIDKKTLKSGVPFVAPAWRPLPDDARVHIELALVWACKFAHTDVAEFLIDTGVDIRATDAVKMTPLHWAAANGCIGLVKRLLERGAPLEVKNAWRGTVLDSTAHFAAFMPVKHVDYAVVMKILVDAGANARMLDEYPRGTKAIDELRLS